jgi:hypothetical protein
LKSLNQVVEHVVSVLQSDSQSVAAQVPNEFQVAVTEIVSRPFLPNRALVVSILDAKPMRELIRQLLSEAISDFTKKANAQGVEPKCPTLHTRICSRILWPI